MKINLVILQSEIAFRAWVMALLYTLYQLHGLSHFITILTIQNIILKCKQKNKTKVLFKKKNS